MCFCVPLSILCPWQTRGVPLQLGEPCQYFVFVMGCDSGIGNNMKDAMDVSEDPKHRGFAMHVDRRLRAAVQPVLNRWYMGCTTTPPFFLVSCYALDWSSLSLSSSSWRISQSKYTVKWRGPDRHKQVQVTWLTRKTDFVNTRHHLTVPHHVYYTSTSLGVNVPFVCGWMHGV
jgi:hypothetical protein